jgi:hypothetical protein
MLSPMLSSSTAVNTAGRNWLVFMVSELLSWMLASTLYLRMVGSMTVAPLH